VVFFPCVRLSVGVDVASAATKRTARPARIDRVIVTGASSGIGFDAARRFLAEGARVIINGRDATKSYRARLELDHADRVIASSPASCALRVRCAIARSILGIILSWEALWQIRS
jgi:NADPH:quinone reductase-like Zn-dependent oxidoreductase